MSNIYVDKNRKQRELIKQFGTFGQKYYSRIRKVLGFGACAGWRSLPEYEIQSDGGDENQKIIKVEYFL